MNVQTHKTQFSSKALCVALGFGIALVSGAQASPDLADLPNPQLYSSTAAPATSPLPTGVLNGVVNHLPEAAISYPVIHNRAKSSFKMTAANGVMNFHPIDIAAIASHETHATMIDDLRKKLRVTTSPGFRSPHGGPSPPSPNSAPTVRQLIIDANGGDPGYTSTYGTGILIGKDTFPDLTVFDINAPNLVAGTVVQGSNNLIQAGHLAALGLARSGGTVMIDTATLKPGATVSEHVANATSAALLTAQNDLRNSAFSPDQAGSTDCRYESVTSATDLSVKAGFSFGYSSFKVSDTFSSMDMNKSSHELVECQETFYTLSFMPDAAADGVIGLDSFFDPSIGVAAASTVMGSGNPPLFVSNVTYGAELLMEVDSNLSSKEMEDALQAAFNYASVSGSVMLDVKTQSELSQMSVKVLSLGGRQSALGGVDQVFTGANTAQALVQWLKDTQDFSPEGNAYDETALPLTYELSYLDFNPVAETASILGDPTVGPNGLFQKAVVYFHSNGDGKNDNTVLDLWIRDASGNILGTTHIPSGQFENNQDSPTFDITPLLNTTTRSAVDDGFFDLLVHTAGDDTWHFTAYIAMCYIDPNTYDSNQKIINVSTTKCASTGGTETEVDYSYSDTVSNHRKTTNVSGVAGPDGSTKHTTRSLVSFPTMLAVSPGS